MRTLRGGGRSALNGKGEYDGEDEYEDDNRARARDVEPAMVYQSPDSPSMLPDRIERRTLSLHSTIYLLLDMRSRAGE